jgi:hypothetical protein
MKVIRQAVTAAHLAGYFITVEARAAVIMFLHVQPALTQMIVLSPAVCLYSLVRLEELVRPQLLMKLPPFIKAEFSTLST